MAAQAGKDLLIRLQEADGTFRAVAGLRSRQIVFNAATVDATHADSVGRWRELLAGAGIRRAAVTGSGIFRDEASDAAMRKIFFDGEIGRWQIVIPDFGMVEGPFQISALEYRGEHDGAVTFEATLESAGALSFTAA